MTPIAAGGEQPTPSPVVPPATTVPTPLKQVGGDGLVFRTTSETADLFADKPTRATGFVLLDQPCPMGDGGQWTVMLFPDDGRYGGAWNGLPATAVGHSAGTKVGRYCATEVSSSFTERAPAKGTAIMRIEPTEPAATAPVSTLTYSVERTSDFGVYRDVFGLAALLGLLLAIVVWFSIRGWRSEPLPKTYGYEKPWATLTTLAAALGTQLLDSGGVLKTISPQYRTTGITIAAVVITGLLAVGPVLVAALYSRSGKLRKTTILATVAGLVMTALAAQMMLSAVYVLTSGIGGDTAHDVAGILVVGVTVLFAVFLWNALVLDLPAPTSQPPSEETAPQRAGAT